jgi:hypothetical protein
VIAIYVLCYSSEEGVAAFVAYFVDVKEVGKDAVIAGICELIVVASHDSDVKLDPLDSDPFVTRSALHYRNTFVMLYLQILFEAGCSSSHPLVNVGCL